MSHQQPTSNSDAGPRFDTVAPAPDCPEEPCRDCDGLGKCPACDGNGILTTQDETERLLDKRCESCEGDGTCWTCEGSGVVALD